MHFLQFYHEISTSILSSFFLVVSLISDLNLSPEKEKDEEEELLLDEYVLSSVNTDHNHLIIPPIINKAKNSTSISRDIRI